MANDTNKSRQVTAADIKGDLAQHLRCPGCTRNFSQVEGRNKIELDRKETRAGDRRAITFLCDECKEKNIAPTRALRYVGGLIQEVPIEDLPDLSPSGASKSSRGVSKRAGTNTRRRRTSKTNPSEDQRTAAEPIAPTLEEEEEP